MSDSSSQSSPVPSAYDYSAAALENVFIVISGMIGAGKSTLATALAKKLNLPVYYEPVANNAYLEDFYADQEKFGFAMQVYLLTARFQQQQEIIWGGKGGVQDRSIYEDSIFAKMLHESGKMNRRDYETYIGLFQNMSNFMKRPNIIVHLDVSPEESLRRIKLRSRECESSIPIEYLRALHKGYDEFLTDISKVIPVIKVNYERFPTVDEMAEAIAEQYASLSTIRHVFYKDTDASGVRTVPAPVAAAAAPAEAEEAEKTV